MSEEKKIKIVFDPSCFDDFEGTQEELDDLVADIQRMADSGELFENCQELDLDELAELDDDFKIVVDKVLDSENKKRKLH